MTMAIMALEGQKYREIKEISGLSIHHIRTLIFRDCLRALGIKYEEKKAPPMSIGELRRNHSQYLIPHFREEINKVLQQHNTNNA
jgi:hypothetical protein